MDAFPTATHGVQRGDLLVYKVSGKMFAVLSREDDTTNLSIKATPTAFHERTRLKGVAPAPYLARAKWIRIHDIEAMAWATLLAWTRESYDLVVSAMPRSKRPVELEK
jgi:predicted DNA-binding protein (MmcQ/YjbR family)